MSISTRRDRPVPADAVQQPYQDRSNSVRKLIASTWIDVVSLIVIVIVAVYWIRYNRAHSLKAKYTPEGTAHEDWKGKTDKDNNPL